MTESVAQPRPSRGKTKSKLAEGRLKAALVLAVFEGIIVAFSKDFSRWTVIIIAAPVIVFYLLAGRTLASETGKQISWILAASQAFAVILVVLLFIIGKLMLIFAAIFAVVALLLILGDRPSRSR